MQQFTFDIHKARDGYPPQDLILWEVPEELLSHREALFRQAGLDPGQIQELGLLTATWQTHPKNAVILAPTVDFTGSEVFAVSREPILSNL